jgi:hypothetical protein
MPFRDSIVEGSGGGIFMSSMLKQNAKVICWKWSNTEMYSTKVETRERRRDALCFGEIARVD